MERPFSYVPGRAALAVRDDVLLFETRHARAPTARRMAAGRLAPDPGGPLEPPQRPPEASQRQNLLSFVFSQDVAHAGQERPVSDRCQRLGALSVMAGFQVSTNGRAACPPRR